MRLTVNGQDVAEVHVDLTRAQADGLADLIRGLASGESTDIKFKVTVSGHTATLWVQVDEWDHRDPDLPA